MKKLVFTAAILTVFISCGNSNSKKSNSQNEKVMTTIHLNQADFLKKVCNYANAAEWKYLGDKPCIIDFYADWCAPCRSIAPALEELAAEYADSLYIYKIDIEAERELADDFGIQSIPALLFVPMEGQPQMSLGALSKAEMQTYIEEILLNQSVSRSDK